MSLERLWISHCQRFTVCAMSISLHTLYNIMVLSWFTVGTGTGKTLSFVLPLLERMSVDGLIRSERGRPPCTLVMAPTRELANQVRRILLEDLNWFKCMCK